MVMGLDLLPVNVISKWSCSVVSLYLSYIPGELEKTWGVCRTVASH